MNRINRFKALEEPEDPTDYEEFEDIAPYNKLRDGKWTIKIDLPKTVTGYLEWKDKKYPLKEGANHFQL